MNKKLIVILTAGFLSINTLFVPSIGKVSANTSKEVTVSSLTVRSGPSTNYKALGYLKKGLAVSVISSSNGWDKINYNGKTGYLYKSYLKVKTASTSTSSVSYKKVTANSLTVRSGSSVNYKAVSYLKKDTVVKVLSTSGSWLKISVGNVTGYVNGKYLANTNAPATVSSKVMYVNSSTNLNMRNARGVNGKILKVIPNNTKVTVSSISNGWGQVSYGGLTGYVNVSYLTEKVPSVSTPTNTVSNGKVMYVNESTGLNLRSTRSYTGNLLINIPNKTKVTVSDIVSGWGKVTYNGKTGYVNAAYLSSTLPTKNTGTTTTITNGILKGKVIVIDPGHGGKFSGAQGIVHEEDINLQISLKVRTNLEKLGAKVIMTRTGDTHLRDVYNNDLVARSNVANNNNANLFVSIHANAGGGTGTETYYYNANRGDAKFATNVTNEISKATGLKNRGAKQYGFAVIRSTKSTIPSILIETGFVDTQKDALILRDKQQEIAQAITTGIKNGF